ncbi:hypothetical protein Tco_1472803 [Tanacetum coccineum]
MSPKFTPLVLFGQTVIISPNNLARASSVMGKTVVSHRILGKSLDEGLAPLMFDEDVLSLLWHAPRDREIEVYVENGVSLVKKQMMEVSLAKGKGVLVENENEALMSKVAPLDEGCGTSIYGYSDSDLRNHPPWSSECKNEKRQQRWSDEFRFRNLLFKIDHEFDLDLSQDPKEKVEEGMQGDLHTLNDNDDDLLQLDDPILDQLLKNVAFLNVELRESVVGVNPPIVVVNALVVHVDARVIALEEDIQRPRKRKREIENESASAIVTFGRPNKRKRLNPTDKTKKGMEDKAMEPNGLVFHV